MQIYVKHFLSGKLLNIKVSSENTVNQVLQRVNAVVNEINSSGNQIENNTNEHQIKEELVLTYAGKELDATRKLTDYSIQDGSKLYVNQKKPSNKSIYVRFLSDKPIKLDADQLYTILDIKFRIYDLENIPPEHQCLYYLQNELENNRPLNYYNIENETVLDLQLRVDVIRVNVKCLNEKIIRLNLLPNNTVRTIKSLIEERESIPIDQQSLEFNGIRLDDERSLVSYEIANESELVLACFYVVHVVTIVGELIDLRVNPFDAIKQVKTNIFQVTKISEDQQHLQFNGKLLRDHKRLSDYGIKNESVLVLDKPSIGQIVILIKTSVGKRFTLELNAFNLIEDVKRRIEEIEHIPSNQQYLIYNKRKLRDNKTLSYYNIKNLSKLYLCYCTDTGTLLKQMDIFIKTCVGTTLKMNVNPLELVKDLKMKIMNKTGFLPNEQQLLYYSIELVDEIRLGDYDICDGSVLNLILNKYKGQIRLYIIDITGRKFSLNVEKNDSVMNLKHKIRDETGIDPDKQFLVFNNRKLEDESLLSQLNIVNDSVLTLILRLKLTQNNENNLNITNSFEINDETDNEDLLGKRDNDYLMSGYKNLEYVDFSEISDENFEAYVKSIAGELIEINSADNLIDNEVNETARQQETQEINEIKENFVRQSSEIVREDDQLNSQKENENELNKQLINNSSQLIDEHVEEHIQPSNDNNQVTIVEPAPVVDTEITNGAENSSSEEFLAVKSNSSIHNASTQCFEPTKHILIHIRTLTGLTIDLNLDSNSTIMFVKTKIQEEEGIPIEQQIIIYENRRLINEKTLEESNIQYGSTLNLVLRYTNTIEVNIEMANSKTFSLNVEQNMLVEDLKTKIEIEKNIPKQQQTLTHNGVHMENGDTLSTYEIHNESTINLTLNLDYIMQLSVKLMDGRVVRVEVLPDDSIELVKEKIQNSEGIPCDKQLLLMNDFILEDSKTLIDYNIHSRITLDLVLKPDF